VDLAAIGDQKLQVLDSQIQRQLDYELVTAGEPLFVCCCREGATNGNRAMACRWRRCSCEQEPPQFVCIETTQ
jgi:hypothetical protein